MTTSLTPVHPLTASRRGDVWLVTHLCPPVGGGGVQRNTKLVKYLSQLGWTMRLVTTKPSAAYVTDSCLLDEVAAHATITRFGSLDPQRIFYVLGRVVRGGVGDGPRVSEGGWLVRVYRVLRDYLFFPDAHVSWVFFGVIGARRLRSSPPSVVIGSHPVPSCLLLAALLGALFRVPVVLDLRDGWVDDRYTNYPTRLHRAAHAWLERRIFNRASLIIANTPELAAAIAGRNPGVRDRTAVVPNGYDNEELERLHSEQGGEAGSTTRTSEARWIAYTGAIHEDRKTVFCAFLEALSRVRQTGATHLRLRVVGGEPPWAAEQILRLGLQDAVEFQPYMPKGEMFGVLRQCDACLVLQPPFDDLAIPGKVYEYLGMGLPILAVINPTGAAARLLGEVDQARYVCASDDVAAITSCLVRFAEGPIELGATAQTIRKYTRQAQAETVSELLTKLLSRQPQ